MSNIFDKTSVPSVLCDKFASKDEKKLKKKIQLRY